MGEHNDAMCSYFTQAENYADFWNGVLFRGRQEIKPLEMEYLDKEYYFRKKKGGNIKYGDQHRDVLAKRKLEKKELLLGLELMDTVDYTMPVRKLFYDAQEYYRQVKEVIRHNREADKAKQGTEKYWKNSGEYLYGFRKEDKIPPLITAALYCGDEEYDGCHDLKDVLKLDYIETECREWISGYPTRIVVLSELDECNFQTGLRELIGVTKRKGNKEALLAYYEENKERFAKLDLQTIETIGVMIGNKKLPEFKQEEGGLDMCKAFDDAKMEGRLEGRLEGKLEGEREGKLKSRLESLRNLMKNLQLTAEQAMEALGIPAEEREMYLEKIV